MKKPHITVLIAILCIIWAFFIEPQIITVKHYKIPNENLAGIRVVWASDFHVKKTDEPKLKKIIDKINNQNADIILLGGDFVNGERQETTLPVNKIMSNIKNLHAKYGIFAVLGNHDNWLDPILVENELKKINIPVLKNNSKKIIVKGKTVYIAGAEDFMTQTPDIEKALENTAKPTILMTHNPDIFPKIPKTVDLSIAGHTHGGQISIPILGAPIVPSVYGNRYAYGYKNENGKPMIISRGLGTSTLHARFNCLPEIVVIDFE